MQLQKKNKCEKKSTRHYRKIVKSYYTTGTVFQNTFISCKVQKERYGCFRILFAHFLVCRIREGFNTNPDTDPNTDLAHCHILKQQIEVFFHISRNVSLLFKVKGFKGLWKFRNLCRKCKNFSFYTLLQGTDLFLPSQVDNYGTGLDSPIRNRATKEKLLKNVRICFIFKTDVNLRRMGSKKPRHIRVSQLFHVSRSKYKFIFSSLNQSGYGSEAWIQIGTQIQSG